MRFLSSGPADWPVMLALSKPAAVTAMVIMMLVIIGVVEVARQWLVAHRRRRMARIFHQAENSYAVALGGLRTMAEVVTGLPRVSPALSRSGVGLLDIYANAAGSFRSLVRRIRTMSRDRAQRHLTREFLKLQANGSLFQEFQREVLRTVSAQAVSGVVDPPSPVRGYRAAFTVLQHRLPRDVWPAMAEILAAATEFAVQEQGGKWRALPVRFVDGARAVFSRKYLERAVALRIIIRPPGLEPKIFEYSVEHVCTAKPSRAWTDE